MHCTHCRIESHDLRAYRRLAGIAPLRDADATAYLCPACRVLNALHPRYTAAKPLVEAETGVVDPLLAREPPRPPGEIVPGAWNPP